MSRPWSARRTARRSLAALAAVPALALVGSAGVYAVQPPVAAEAAVLPTAYGAVALGTARYAVPATARYVSPSGSDSAGGTATAPYRTLAKAVSASPSGTTVVLRGGTYREAVTFYGKQLTIQNYPGEKVWLTGSDPVSGWVADGDDFRKDGWTTAFKHGTRTDLTNPKYPLAAYPEMVFVDNAAQRQVATRAEVVPGTFFADYTNQRLYVGTNPAGRQVESSKRKRALYLNQAHGSVVRGIGVLRYANHPDDLGAVLAEGSGIVLENVLVQQNAAIGVSFLGPNGVVRDSSITDNGQLGLHANRANGLMVEDNLLQHNNTENFAITGAQGNFKATSTVGVTVRDNLVRYSRGRGLWFDIDSSNIVVVRNALVDNADRGLQVELAGSAIVASNLFVGNGSDAISMLASQNVQVYNNSFWRNGRSMFVVDDARDDVANITARNNVTSGTRNGTSQIVAVEDTTRSRTAAAMGVTLNNDAYAQQTGYTAAWWFGWASYPSSYRVFSSLSAFRTGTGQESRGVSTTTTGAEPYFTDPANGDFTVRLGSPPTTVLPAALPSSVAAALGLASGATPALGALRSGSTYAQPVWPNV